MGFGPAEKVVVARARLGFIYVAHLVRPTFGRTNKPIRSPSDAQHTNTIAASAFTRMNYVRLGTA